MADAKISGLTAASTPLAGTELLELVQGGNSTKVTAAAVGNAANGVRTVATGGTGAATLTGYVKGNGTSAMTAAATVPWSDISAAPTNHAAFYDSTNQTASANTATVMLLRFTQVADGVTVAGNSRMTIPTGGGGVYEIAYSVQFVNPTAANVNVSSWLRKNGTTDVTNSCSDVSVNSKSGAINGYSLMMVSFFVTLSAGDYVELMWSTPDTGVYMEALAARTTPTRPAAPSVFVTVQQVI